MHGDRNIKNVGYIDILKIMQTEGIFNNNNNNNNNTT
jgi:hypothetical protein